MDEKKQETRFLEGKKVTFGTHKAIKLPQHENIETLEVEVTSGNAQESGEDIMSQGKKHKVSQGKYLIIHQSTTLQLHTTYKDS
jgi:hypothetical protein